MYNRGGNVEQITTNRVSRGTIKLQLSYFQMSGGSGTNRDWAKRRSFLGGQREAF